MIYDRHFFIEARLKYSRLPGRGYYYLPACGCLDDNKILRQPQALSWIRSARGADSSLIKTDS
eukprot:scaffold73224_cov58-Attheya_sp.AAC.3